MATRGTAHLKAGRERMPEPRKMPQSVKTHLLAGVQTPVAASLLRAAKGAICSGKTTMVNGKLICLTAFLYLIPPTALASISFESESSCWAHRVRIPGHRTSSHHFHSTAPLPASAVRFNLLPCGNCSASSSFQWQSG